MFTKILIANRGEIACRIIQTAKRLGLYCIAIYSEIDADALHVHTADEAHCVGPAPSSDSYLHAEKIIAIAKARGAQAIHPGFGFLAENADFATACENNGIVFIGPSPKAISVMGSKAQAKLLLEKTHVPLIPGYHGKKQDLPTLQKAASTIGYPVLLKASAGGGGKGMRIVREEKDFESALASTKREALSSFANDHMIIEKYVENPRHVEIQVFADQQGNTVHLFERDCSIQRRHQKILEEAPAPGITDPVRDAMGKTAIEVAKAIDYVGAGTIEFLLTADHKFYFMEMNTRLQVEHPVTEYITGLDLVEWQLRVAAGEPLPLQQDAIHFTGHAIEARVYAEDPQNNFLPSVGQIIHYRPPQVDRHLRLDSGIRENDTISVYYDPMIAKLIVYDETREACLHRLTQALMQFQIAGVTTNLSFLSTVTQHPQYQQADFDTGFIEQHEATLLPPSPLPTQDSISLAALYLLCQQQTVQSTKGPYSPWHERRAWQMHLQPKQYLRFTLGDQPCQITVEHHPNHYRLLLPEPYNTTITAKGILTAPHTLSATLNETQFTATLVQQDSTLYLFTPMDQAILHLDDPVSHYAHDDPSAGHLLAPMPGTIVAIHANPGQTVERGTALLVIEAMKMEHTIIAPTDGTIKSLHYQVGDLVNEGEELLDFEGNEGSTVTLPPS